MFTFRNFQVIIFTLVTVTLPESLAEDAALFKNNDVFYCVVAGNDLHAALTLASSRDSTIAGSWPDTSANGINCKLDSGEGCLEKYLNNYWTLITTIKFNSGFLFDRRWEDLKIEDGQLYKDDKEEFKIKNELSVRDSDAIELPISVKAQSDLHVFFCEHSSIFNCYWFIIAGWGGVETALRKCSKIPRKNNVPAEDDCKKPLKKEEHGQLLSSNEWKHFLIRKDGTSLTVRMGGSTQPLLTYDDAKEFKNLRHVFVSLRSAGKYKVHRFDYIRIEREKIHETENLKEYLNKDTFCMSMFISMCSDCKLILELHLTDNEMINKTTIEAKNENWQEHSFEFNIEKFRNKKKFLYLRTVGNSINKFWAIDDIRSCTQNDYRWISFYDEKKASKCTILKNNYNTSGYTAYDLKISDVQRAEKRDECINYNEFKIGKKCYPNKFGNLQTVCQLQEGDVKCSCMPGYYGGNCSRCQDNSYGYNCEKKCGMCEKVPCNYVNGSCGGNCLTPYSGDDCKISEKPILNNPPVIIKVSYNSVIVQIQNNSYTGSKSPVYYKFQYKAAAANDEWLDYEDDVNVYRWNDLTVKRVEGFNASVDYKIRAVLLSEDNLSETGDFLAETEQFTTPCEDLTESNILFNYADDVTNTSAEFTIEVSRVNCPTKNYHIMLDEEQKQLHESDGVIIIKGLKPYKNYTLSFSRKSKKATALMKIPFETKEGVPGKISSLEQTKSTPTSISIRWRPPAEPNGKIRKYNIYYRHLKYNGCKENMTEGVKSADSIPPTVNIGDLRPYSTYIIGVTAETVAEGLVAEDAFTTSHTDVPDDDELPDLEKSMRVDENTITIQHTIDCAKKKGNYSYLVNLRCEDWWCRGADVYKEYFTSNDTIKIPNLISYSNYSLKLKVRRSQAKPNDNVLKKKFKTSPSVPGNVTELKAFSKSYGFISLKWKPPIPPNGVLERYQISCCLQNDCNHHWNVQPETCKIWEELHCFNITENLGRFERQLLNITVRAINQGVQDVSKPASIEERLVPEFLDPPLNPEAYFDEENNLVLKWQHPERISSNLQQFSVNVANIQTVKYDGPFDQLNFTMVAHVDVPYEEKLGLSFYTLNVEERSSSASTIEIYCPPETPRFTEQEPRFKNVSSIWIPPAQSLSRNGSSYLFVMVTDGTENSMPFNETLKRLCKIPRIHNTWIAYGRKFKKERPSMFSLELGSGSSDRGTSILGMRITNNALTPNTHYNVCVILMNEFMTLRRYNIYPMSTKTYGIKPRSTSSANNPALYALILLLLFVPLIACITYRKRRGMNILPSINRTDNQNPDIIPLTSIEERKPRPVVVPKSKLPEPNGTVADEKFSKPIMVVDFEEYVKGAVATGELERQHSLFPRGQTKPWTYGSEKPNKLKNRYNNLIAYDHTRVMLEKIDGDPYSDYINANYIEGYVNPKTYIATQGPKASTVNDFWRMIWQENVLYIVMLANVIEGGKKKTEQYWPNINETLKFADIFVAFVSSELFADYEFRTFSVTCNRQERKVQQLHFTSWPDHGVPMYSQSLVPFLQKMLTIPQGQSPIVVHCSAGVGRTGTIILCDLCLRMAAREKKMDVLWHQYKLREQRPNMVDNIEQYKLVHIVLLDCLVAPKTSIPCDAHFKKTVEKVCTEEIQNQIHYLDKTMWQDEVLRGMMGNVDGFCDVPEKNRFQDIVPDGYSQIFLPRYPDENDDASKYINAINVDGFRTPNKYIVTQQPLPGTVGDFWRLVYEKESSIIISLNEIDPSDKTCCIFWPTKSSPNFKPVPFIKLVYSQEFTSDIYDTITIHLYYDESGQTTEKRIIHLVLFKHWPYENIVPDRVKNFVTFCQETGRISRAGGKIIVTCYDGARASGLFVSSAFVLEKIKLEQLCDVCLAVRVSRHNRKQFVQNKEQIIFTYQLAVEYISEFETYSNFVPSCS